MYGYLLKKWRFIIQLFMFIQFLSQCFLSISCRTNVCQGLCIFI
ncbi:hypothetical protein HMPREF0262_00135 [Clostridium sp. ATCC 29733]|nr:hypothetical protein HMPREF0262_00135 [Clostridium sp. ATCC 29733]